MKFIKPAQQNPIDQGRVVGKPTTRIDGPLKTTGTAVYSYEWKDVAPNAAYGFVVGAAVPTGRIRSFDLAAAQKAPGVLDIVTYKNAGPLGLGDFNTAPLLGGPKITHYHQAVALVIAETFEQARAAAGLVKVDYARGEGVYELSDQKDSADPTDAAPDSSQGDFQSAFESAAVKIDQTYETASHAHAMMEPHATIAVWEGDELTVWSSNQMVEWGRQDIAKTLKISPDKVRLVAPYIGGGFGGKLFVRADAILAALGAKLVQRPVKVVLQRPLIFNNTVHRPSTIQRIRLGATEDGNITSVAHETWSGDLEGGGPEASTQASRPAYAGDNRLMQTRLAVLNLPEGNAMRAPGDMPGSIAIEVAMDELAEKLGIDPVEFRVMNDTQINPDDGKPFSRRKLVECLQRGASEFGWEKRPSPPASKRDGRWLVGMGVAAAIRGGPATKSAARVRLDSSGKLVVETDMTDIGTGSYTILAQTAAEMLGLPLEQVEVRLGDSSFPVSAGSGGQWGATSSTSGVYAACVSLREKVRMALGLNAEAELNFAGGSVSDGSAEKPLTDALATGPLEAEGEIDFEGRGDDHSYFTFGAHFVEIGVDVHTAEIRIRRMLAVCDAGRIFNPISARSQVIGGMTMGAGAALMEDLHVDARQGFFANHDLASYEVPVHMDIPHQECIFLDGDDPLASPMKGSGVGELGICGVSAAIGNAIYNATGIRVREYPITLDKLLDQMPEPV